MSIVRVTLLCALLGFLPVAASSQPAPSQAEWIKDLRLGGYVIVFRHGATNSDQANADPMSRPNVSTQRQLNDQGRAQAKSIGESMRKLKIPVGRVLASTTQRAIDTGTLLGVGEVTATPDLTESGPAVSPDENNRRALAFRELVAARRQQPCDRFAQAEHRRCVRQGLARCPRGRGIGVRAGRQWRLQVGCPHPGERMEQAGSDVEWILAPRPVPRRQQRPVRPLIGA
jgi:hypothetical protein